MTTKEIIQKIIADKEANNRLPLLATGREIINYCNNNNIDVDKVHLELCELVEAGEIDTGKCWSSDEYYK